MQVKIQSGIRELWEDMVCTKSETGINLKVIRPQKQLLLQSYVKKYFQYNEILFC